MNSDSVLFHASTQRDLERIEPKRTLSKNKYIGDYVFATPNKRIAAMYLAPREGGTILINTFDGEPYAVINNNPVDFNKVDKGGAIYEVSADGFTESPQTGLGDTELVNVHAVVPASKEVFETSLDAMKQMGVKVYFLDDTEFENVQNAKDHGWELLSRFKPHD